MGILFITMIMSAGCIAEYDEPKVSDYAKHAAVSPVAEQGNMIVSEIESRAAENSACKILSSEKVADEIIDSNKLIESIYGEGLQTIAKNTNDDPVMDTELRIFYSNDLKRKILEDVASDELNNNANEIERQRSWGKSTYHCNFNIEFYQEICRQYSAYTLFDAIIIGMYKCEFRHGLRVSKGKC